MIEMMGSLSGLCVCTFGGDNHPVLNRRVSTSSWWQALQVRNFCLFVDVYNKTCKSLRFNTGAMAFGLVGLMGRVPANIGMMVLKMKRSASAERCR